MYMKFSPLFWFSLGIILTVLEILLPGFIIIWFGAGAVLTAFFAIFVKNPWAQLIFFIVSSGILLFFSPKISSKVYKKKKTDVGSERFAGVTGIVVKKISPPSPGLVKIEGEEWRAFADTEIKENTFVEVIKVEGTHLWVKRKEEK